MGSLLSIDWDYFISTNYETIYSYVENKKSLLDAWYKRYFQEKSKGRNLLNYFQLSGEIEGFWKKIQRVFKFDPNIKVFVSDSHALSYTIAKECDCKEVYLFDAHSDLGYGGLSSLNFNVTCANWLGKLLSEKNIERATLIYSPYTKEKPDDFYPMNKVFNINYLKFNDLCGDITISAIHICRSGAWSPPWYDKKFVGFINGLGLPYKVIDCPIRKWDTKNITFSEQIQYLMV